MDIVQEIKSKLNIVDVVRDYGVVHPISSGNFKTLCPFHDDHHPSMILNVNKSFAWCFSCNSGGDIFSFVQQKESCSFSEAVEILAQKANIDFKKVAINSDSINKRKKIISVIDYANNFFVDNLSSSDIANNFLNKRELPEDIKKYFSIGFTDNKKISLENYLLKNGFSHKDMVDSGLFSYRDNNKKILKERFVNRVTFPIYDNIGNICGFGGRYIGNNKNYPKYINSPETEIYDKSKIIYGFFQAKKEIQKSKKVFLVEGYFDCLAFWKIGVKNVVSMSGTALTDDQIKILKNYIEKVVISLDSDQAGMNATKKVIVKCLEHDISTYIVDMQKYKDPDEAIRENKESFLLSLEKHQDALLFFMEKEFKDVDFLDINEKKKFIGGFLKIINSAKNPIVKDHYLYMLSKITRVSKHDLIDFSQDINPDFAIVKDKKKTWKIPTELEYFIGLLIAFPKLCTIAKSNFLCDYFKDCQIKNVYNELINNYNFSGDFYENNLEKVLDIYDFKKWCVISMYSENSLSNLPDSLKEAEFKNIVKKLNVKILQERIKSIINSMSSGDLDSKIKEVKLLNELITQFNN